MHSTERRPLELDIAELRVQLKEREAMLVDRDETIARLIRDLALLRSELARLLSGGRRDDATAPGQGLLFGELELLEVAPAAESTAADPKAEEPTNPKQGSDDEEPKRRTKRLDLSFLPREEVVHELPAEQRHCPVTGLPLVVVGEKVQEELVHERAKLKVRVHRRHVYGPSPADAAERKIDSIVAPMPPMPIDGCVAGASFIAALLTNKQEDHLPLYRQELIFQRYGLLLPRRLTCEWSARGGELLEPIVDAMFSELCAAEIHQLDDTPVKCQGGKGGKMRQARMWVFSSPESPNIVFKFTRGRAADEVVPFLDSRAGYLVGDGLQVNKSAAEKAGGTLVICGCWAHAFRKFRDALKSDRAVAELFMHDIGDLFDIERDADKSGVAPSERLRMRMARAPVILERMFVRLENWRSRHSESSSLGKALTYLENQWDPLGQFLTHGVVPLENNRCERAIRPIAIGRRNWLFLGSERGGRAAAVVASLVATCRGLKIDTEQYLTDVLARIRVTASDRVVELTPARWLAARGAAADGLPAA